MPANKLDVLYVDYGNTELIGFSKIRSLHPKFQNDEMFAIPISLANVRYNSSYFRFI